MELETARAKLPSAWQPKHILEPFPSPAAKPWNRITGVQTLHQITYIIHKNTGYRVAVN